jgi:hypothetical protein
MLGLPNDGKRGTWYASFELLVSGLRASTRENDYRLAGYRVFVTEGNQKLPFASFSALPIVTCPGAGACATWCYSLTAWRNPGAFCRQLQNTLLLRFADHVVASAFKALPESIDVRLYVDGDFESVERVAFWMALCEARNDLVVYGYSKSWAQLLEFERNDGVWPKNYTLNLSSGSKYEQLPNWKEAMLGLPITRGEFVAVKIDDANLPRGFKRYDSDEYHQRVREALRAEYGKRTVSCGGQCGSCGAKQHWCGDQNLKNVVIGIGIH